MATEFSALISPVFSVPQSFRNHSNMLIANMKNSWTKLTAFIWTIFIKKVTFDQFNASLLNKSINSYTQFYKRDHYKCIDVFMNELIIWINRSEILTNLLVWISLTNHLLNSVNQSEHFWIQIWHSNWTRLNLNHTDQLQYIVKIQTSI